MKDPVIIIGMHRSGLSRVSGILSSAGVFMGADLNENAGSQFFCRLNEWIFTQAGATWDNPYNFSFINDDFNAAVLKNLRRQLSGKTLRKYLGAGRKDFKTFEEIDFDWGWMDSLNTFTIDIWKAILKNAKVIHVHRNPLDVAVSLKDHAYEMKRRREHKTFSGFRRRLLENRFTPERIYDDSLRVLHLNEGFKLWVQYIDEALQVERKTGFETLQLSYENLIAHSDEEIKKLFHFLGFKLTDGLIADLARKPDKLEMNTFLKDKELLGFYQTIKNHPMVTALGYDNLQ